LQICGACIVFSGCSENGPVIAHIPEITPAPGDSPSNTIADGYSDEYATQYGLVLIKAVTLNNQGYTGKGVRVAVVDTGIDHAHSEFKGRQILGTNFGNDARGIGYDSDGHGTHVASIIGANRNAFGMRGVAYDVRCLIPRFDGAIFSLEWKEALWDKYFTAAPRPRTPSEQQYSDRKLQPRR
jgi:subtilisin family serine protease